MDKFDFEKALARLEEINKKLSEPDTGLDEGIELYAEGAKLAGLCRDALEQARIKIEQVNGQ